MKISLDGETITFRSVSPFFERERDGRKPNTERAFTDLDEQDVFASSVFGLKRIEITDGNGRFFTRSIVDITCKAFVGALTLWVISWRHSDDKDVN